MTRGGFEITSNRIASKKKSHVPIRTCIVCRKKKAKSELIRLVIDHDNKLIADIKGSRKGRGAYICQNRSCGEKLILSKKMDRIFKNEVRAISQTLRFNI